MSDRQELNGLKSQIDLVQLIQQSGVELKKVGKNWLGRCPFHDDQKASLSVKPETQLFKCFGCQAAGDAFNFVELKEELTFPEAVKRLEALVGVLEPIKPAQNGKTNGKACSQNGELPGGLTRPQLLERVTHLYQAALLESTEAQQYLTSRGLGQRDVWTAFRAGFCTGNQVRSKVSGPTKEALIELGVLNEKGQEHFRGCVVVPLEHPDQGIVGLYGRRIDPEATVKHLFLPGPREGLVNWPACKSPTVYLTEGVLDAMSLWAAGVQETTCLYGLSQLPKGLLSLLEHYETREVRFCLDADQAGQEALQRLAGSLMERGLRCQTVRLPDKDPNAVLCSAGPKALQQAVHLVEPIEVSGQVNPPDLSEPQREDIPDGFKMRFGSVLYVVKPRPPFGQRVRAQIRASREDKTHVDTIDLACQKGRSQAINPISRRLSLAKPEVERHLMALFEIAEEWVEHSKTKAKTDIWEVPPTPILTVQEKAEAVSFLRRSDLVGAVLNDMETMGYVGEENGKLLAYLIGVSRKLDAPLSAILLSQSGAGKSGLMELIELLTPPEDVVALSRITAQGFTYMPKDRLVRRLVLLEERAGGEGADYQIRVLQSRKRLDTVVPYRDPETGQMKAQQITVLGPIAYLETTTNPNINHENATRCFEIPLDESEAQTQRILERQRQARCFVSKNPQQTQETICKRHHDAQRMLEVAKVFIPYVKYLTFPTRWIRARRDHERFLSLIEASTLVHQFQRKSGEFEDGGRYFLATLEDYRVAYKLSKEILNATFHELTRDARELWEQILFMARELPSGKEFTRKKLRNFTGWQQHRLRDALRELVEMEYVNVLSGQQGSAYNYQVNEPDNVSGQAPASSSLLTPEQLAERLKEPAYAR